MLCVPAVWQRQLPLFAITQKTVEVPQAQFQAQKAPKTVETPRVRFNERVVDVPVVMPRQVPTIQRVQKVEEVPQVECSDMVVDVPVMMQRQVSTTQLVQKTREVSQTQHIDKIAEVPVMMQRQIPMSAKVQKTVEMPQVQYIDEAVDVTIAMQTLVPTAQTSQKREEVPQVQYRHKLIDVPVVLKRQETTIQSKAKTLNVFRTSCFDRGVDVPDAVQQHTLMDQKVQRKIEVAQVLEQIVKPIMDGMVPQISQTEVMKKIVQTVRDKPDTWSRKTEEKNALEENRIIECDDRCADGWVEVKRKRTRTSQRKPSKSKHCGRTSEGAGEQSKGTRSTRRRSTMRRRRDQVSQIYAEMADGKTVVLDVRLNDVDRYTSHVTFLMQFTPRNWCAITLHGSSVCMRASPHIHAIHDERLSVCSSLLLRSDSLRVSLLYFALLFPLLLVL